MSHSLMMAASAVGFLEAKAMWGAVSSRKMLAQYSVPTDRC